MTTHSLLATSAGLQLHPSPDALPVVGESFVLMSCEACDLAGGPFPPAEAAYLQAIHTRVHHGFSTAA